MAVRGCVYVCTACSMLLLETCESLKNAEPKSKPKQRSSAARGWSPTAWPATAPAPWHAWRHGGRLSLEHLLRLTCRRAARSSMIASIAGRPSGPASARPMSRATASMCIGDEFSDMGAYASRPGRAPIFLQLDFNDKPEVY